MKQKILFICTHNAARSQMAEGIVNARCSDRFEAFSAGTEQTVVNPFAVEALGEIGIDISHHRSKSVEEFRGQQFDVVVTVCDNARETCPFFPGKRVIHKSFEDPAKSDGNYKAKLEKFREIRDQIGEWLHEAFGTS